MKQLYNSHIGIIDQSKDSGETEDELSALSPRERWQKYEVSSVAGKKSLSSNPFRCCKAFQS